MAAHPSYHLGSQTRKAAPAMAILVLTCGIILGLFAAGVLRLGPTEKVQQSVVSGAVP
jgi:hypothetical protein